MKYVQGRIGRGLLATAVTTGAGVIFGCGSSFKMVGSPENVGDLLVKEEGEIVAICSAFESNNENHSSKLTDLLRREQQENLGALLDALRDAKARTEPNVCRSSDVSKCAEAIRDAFQAAKTRGDDLAKVAEGIEAAFGDVSSLSDEGVAEVAAKIRFSVLAVDGYIRFANGLERDVDQFVAGLDIPIPLASAMVRSLAREVTAEVVAHGTANLVQLLEKNTLVHRPAMIRQACERYLTNTDLGSVASQGLRRIILSASDDPAKFTRLRCEELKIIDEKGGEVTERYGACSAIANAAKTGSPLRDALTRAEDERLPMTEDGLVEGTLSPLRDEHPKHDEVQAATIVQAAAAGCALFGSADGPPSARCSEVTFNVIGSAAALDPPPSSGGDVPDVASVKKLALRVEELLSAQGRTSAAVEQLRGELEDFVANTGSRLDRVDRELADFSRAQRDMVIALKRCAATRDRVRNERRNVFDSLGTGPSFKEVCDEGYTALFARRNLPNGQEVSVYVDALCNEQRAVPVTIWIDGGLFDTGKANLATGKQESLKEIWDAIKPKSARSPVKVIGHVDSRGFAKDRSDVKQRTLAESRAKAAIAVLQHVSSDVEFTASIGDVPPPGPCGSHQACATWRTVSLDVEKLFPVLDIANCK